MKPRQTAIQVSLVMLLLGAPSAAVNAQVPAQNVNISNLGGAQSEVGIAVDPTDPETLVAVSNNIPDLSRLGVWFSTDGGLTWTANFLDENQDGLGAGDIRFDPNVAFDSDGNVYVVYSTSGSDNRLLLARSTDGGQNFNQVTTVTTDAPTASNLHTAMVTTRSDGGAANPDDVLVVWARVQAGGESIEAALSLDAGVTFPTTNSNINDALQRTFLPWAAADGSGDFQVVWEVNQGGGVGVILHDTLDGTTLADGANNQITTVQITDFGAATSKIPAQPDRGLFSVSTVDVDRITGRIFVSYTDRPNTGSNDTDIYVRISDDNGVNWSARTQVNDDATTTSQFMPRLAMDQVTGFVGVSWYDARNDTTNNQQVDVFVSVSKDGGLTWTANQQVTTARSDESTANAARNGNNYGEYFGLIAQDGVAHAAWTDARAANFTAGTNEDVYTALIFVDVPPLCDANGSYVAECEGSPIALDGSNSVDPDGGSLAFLWEGPFDGSPVNGSMPSVSFPAPPGLKSLDLTVEDDEGDSAMCTAPVTVQDTLLPTLLIPGDITAECESPAGTAVDIGNATATDMCDPDPDIANDAPALFPLGQTDVTWTATDDSNNQVSAIQMVTIVDTTPPDFELAVTPDVLWPPNHKLVTIQADITMITDTCDPDPAVTLVSIASNEPDNGAGDGNTVNDIQGADFGTDDREFQLRAERSGQGSGRVYTITYMVTDGSGNQTTKEATVTVPNNRGRS